MKARRRDLRDWIVGAIITISVAGALALPAFGASHTDTQDPNDTPGLLDVREVRFDHSPALRWTFDTFARWTVERIWDHGTFVVQLDTHGDEEMDTLIVVRSDGRELQATLLDLKRDGREVQRAVLNARKENARSLSVAVALHRLQIGRGRTSYLWSALSIFTGSACRRTCLDRIPDEGSIEQFLPGASPSPSPSPSPTPSPTPTPSPVP